MRGAYVADAGTTLKVVDAQGHRRPLLQVGQWVVLSGKLRGLEGQILELSGCRLLPTP